MAEISRVGVAVGDWEPPVVLFFFLETSDLVLWVCLPFMKSFKRWGIVADQGLVCDR